MEAKHGLDQDEAIYQAGKVAGIREVVEWIESQRMSAVTLVQGYGYCNPIKDKEWQAKLKEWGIE